MPTNETDLLLSYLAQQRAGIINATHGLTEEQAASRPTQSALSLVSLLQHVILVEETWIGLATGGGWPSDPSRYYEALQVQLAPCAELVERYRSVAAGTEAAIRALPDLDRLVPVPQGVPWFPDDVEGWSVRWILLHVIEEIARHAGHADFLREAIDGATMYSLMAAVEDWPDSPWIKRWTPAASRVA